MQVIMLQRIKSFFDENDIYALTFMPPMLGFGGYFVSLFVIEKLSEKPIPESYIYIGLAVASLIGCIAGVAQIYKKEMPGSLGRVIKGNIAVVSGVITVVFMSFGIIVGFVHGISILISK